MQNQGVVEIGVVPTIPFSIFIDVQYNRVKIVVMNQHYGCLTPVSKNP